MRPVTSQPPSTGTARVATPVVAPGASPSENGWLWIIPSSTTPRYIAARMRSWFALASGGRSNRSATWPHHNMVALCMLNVRPVAPQDRPTSSLTRT